LESEGRKESAFRDAEARERAAVAEASATRAVSQAIEEGGAQAINYFIAQKYVEAIGKFATSPNAKTILFPVEATQLMGTLGGIGELQKMLCAMRSRRRWPILWLVGRSSCRSRPRFRQADGRDWCGWRLANCGVGVGDR
jgi:hypothetical protein